jgi:hypothetical protein
MTDTDYLIYGSVVTFIVLILNFAAFFLLPLVLRQVMQYKLFDSKNLEELPN